MRCFRSFAFAGLLCVSLPVAGCAASTAAESSGGRDGTGGTPAAGGGGEGGSDCEEEVCDGVDNNCDGAVDEGCECLAGDSKVCYSGPAGTEKKGICATGTQECDPKTNKFGPCLGEVLPTASETCDGQDENCNGIIDDGIADLQCGVGACAVTVPACLNGEVGQCVPGMASAEECDGIDNDCDQLTDEDFPESAMMCDTGQLGVCSTGVFVCLGGALMCMPDSMPTPESCDDLDNNCDGMVDNGIAGTGGNCSTGAPGVCSAGTLSCQDGVVDCFPVTPSSPELCDGLDNDCDGTVDEGNPEGGVTCSTGQLGACGMGTLNCVGGALVCQSTAVATTEVCDGLDNNCNGQVDDGIVGAGQMCSCGGTSACANGVLKCQGCNKEVDCNNGLDDDGDGAADCADSQCGLGCNAVVQPCPAGQKLLVLSSTDVAKGIVDNATATSVLAFSETAVVKRAVLQINITHTNDADLDISLKSPANTTINVSSDNGVNGLGYANTIFNDGCSSIITGVAPFFGCFSPETALSAFVNQPLKGTWTLQVADDAAGNTGVLLAWTLAMCVQ